MNEIDSRAVTLKVLKAEVDQINRIIDRLKVRARKIEREIAALDSQRSVLSNKITQLEEQ